MKHASSQLVPILLALVPAALAAEPPSNAPYANVQLRDPAAEARAKALMLSLRCVVCQGQSIVDSDASMAGDMRSLVRTRIAAGESAESIRGWLVARYGNYVSYDPPFAASWPLWLAPIALLAAGALIARGSFRRRR
ncbi:cytochrome c-type biogenesis protein [uncultured Sphingomonas sp.]|uniref:cytochrome c-type biogenesis protein n=1 Tax=uncultured Sphingomonas sp. TaxID=158754 RepID=UPI0035CB2BF9